MAHTEPKRVMLVDPSGNEFPASTPAEVSNLVYGSGYRIKEKGLTVDDAAALLAEKGAAAEFLEAPAAPATTASKGDSKGDK
jgi:hypothetical protein